MVPVPLYNATPALVLSSLYPNDHPNPKINYNRKLDVHHRNQKMSPLLRLPPEIRILVWIYLLSGATLHILWTDRGIRRCRKCSANPIPDLFDLACRHDPGSSVAKFSPLNCILLISRQLRAEISSLILTHVTFVFDSPYAFYSFFSRYISTARRSEIARIHIIANIGEIENTFGNDFMLSWNRVLHPRMLNTLTGLKELRLTISTSRRPHYVFDLDSNVVHAKYSRGFLRFREVASLRDVGTRIEVLVGTGWRPHNAVDLTGGADVSLAAKDLRQKILRERELSTAEVEEAKKVAGSKTPRRKGPTNRRPGPPWIPPSANWLP